jgi:formylglycine-generating enzyme required for sulfatase activity
MFEIQTEEFKKVKWALGAGLMLVLGMAGAQGQTNVGLGLQMYAGISVTGVVGHVYEIQATANGNDTNSWNGIAAIALPEFPQPYLYFDPNSASAPRRFYRAVDRGVAPANTALIPAGIFIMGDSMGDGVTGETPPHPVLVSAFYMDKYEVTKQLWDAVYTWAAANGYSFDNAGLGKAANHPVQTINWYDCVKWCNARSQQEGKTPAYYTDAELTVVYKTGQAAPYVRWDRGYRLPTEAEWEKAARGGLNGKRFPWGDTISHNQANYYAASSYSYDLSYPAGYHPSYQAGDTPYTSPVGSFAANGYGLYDMSGNVWEWCWDWYGSYDSATQTDPHGPASGSDRVGRGGGWDDFAWYSRSAYRNSIIPTYGNSLIGFRSVLSPGQ